MAQGASFRLPLPAGQAESNHGRWRLDLHERGRRGIQEHLCARGSAARIATRRCWAAFSGRPRCPNGGATISNNNQANFGTDYPGHALPLGRAAGRYLSQAQDAAIDP